MRVSTDKPYPLFEGMLASAPLLPASLKDCQSPTDWTHPVGTSDTHLIRRDNDAYVLEQRRDGRVRRVRIQANPSYEEVVKQVINGRTDLAVIDSGALGDVGVEALLAKADPACSVRTISEPRGDYFVIIEASPKSAYARPEAAGLRRAIAMALHREKLKGTLPSGFSPWARPLGPQALGLDPTAPVPDAQTDAARALFKAEHAGVPKLRLPLRIGSTGASDQFAARVVQQLGAAGIESEFVELALANIWPAYESGLVDFALYHVGDRNWRNEATSDHMLKPFDPPTHVVDRTDRAIAWAAAERRFLETMPAIIVGHAPHLAERVAINCGRVKDPAGTDGKIDLTRLRSPLSLELNRAPKNADL